MTDPFSISAGAVGIASAFTACVDCFEYVQFGRNFGRDFQTSQLTLDCARLRLTRWGQAVNIYNDPQLTGLDATALDIEKGKDIFQQILVLFADSERFSNNYRLKAKSGDDLSISSTADMNPIVKEVCNRMKELANKRRKRTSLAKTMKWAPHDRSSFKELISDITSLIDNLEKLFPAPEVQASLAREEAEEIGDKEMLEHVENASQGIDPLLCEATKGVLDRMRIGHLYSDFEVVGNAQVGNVFGNNWSGRAVQGAAHTFKGVRVNGTTLMGDTYGGKGLFD